MKLSSLTLKIIGNLTIMSSYIQLFVSGKARKEACPQMGVITKAIDNYEFTKTFFVLKDCQTPLSYSTSNQNSEQSMNCIPKSIKRKLALK
jgi:hypothetical protein